MKRPLKFRIWDNKVNRFTYFDIFSTFGRVPVDCEDNIQQFTGLLDKRGKEIYEGDIVRAPANGARYIVKFGTYISRYGENIEDLEHGFYIEGTFDPTDIESMAESDQWLDVIGNIFEDR